MWTKHTVPKTTKKNEEEGSKCEDENVERKIEDIDYNSDIDEDGDDDISENEKTFLNPLN